MCFGNMTTQKKVDSTSTSQGPQWLTDAAKSNLDFAGGIQSAGFTPYSGQQVANFSPQQQSSFNLGGDIASGVQPYVGQSGSLISNYANAGPQHVQADSIASQMSPYMNQYVNMALQPQLALQDQQFAAQNKGFDAQATGAGAYGDTGWGLGRTNLTQQQNIGRSGLIGNAYNSAFNTAIGAGAQDVSNRLNASTANANYAETALGRQLGGANALTGQGTQATQLINSLGGQQTAQGQAGLNAAFNQWQMAQQYPFQTAQLNNQTLAAAKGASPTYSNGTQTTQAPDNSGFGLLGSLAGVAAAPFTGGLSLLPAAGGMFTGNGTQSSMGGGAGGGVFAADGGAIAAGQPTIVGERGPELIVPGANSVVIPNEVLAAARDKRAKKVAPKFSLGLAA